MNDPANEGTARSLSSEGTDTGGSASDTPACSGLARWLLFTIGLLSMGLAAAGAFLPVLPTTPFVIVAAACFVRSSPRFHRRLLANRVFGPYIGQWQHDHTIPRDAKRKAYGLVVVSFGISILLIDVLWLRVTLVALGLGLVLLLVWLPTTPVEEEPGPPSD